MNKNGKNTLVYIAFIIFVLNITSMLSVIAYILALKVLGIAWIGLASIVLILLVSAVFVRNKSKDDKDNAYDKDNAIYHQFRSKIPANIRLWKNTCSLECSKIRNRIEQTVSIKECGNTADNHSLHSASSNTGENNGSTKRELNRHFYQNKSKNLQSG